MRWRATIFSFFSGYSSISRIDRWHFPRDFLFLFLLFLLFHFPAQVWYKGFFIPIDATASTDCPTECPPLQPITTVATTPTKPPAATSAQSWGDAPAKIAIHPKPQHSDVETFDASGKLTTAKPKLEALDGEKQQQSNVNIEIHNVFSFGTANNSLLPSELQPQPQQSPLNGQTDNKISLPNDEPRIIYAWKKLFNCVSPNCFFSNCSKKPDNIQNRMK